MAHSSPYRPECETDCTARKPRRWATDLGKSARTAAQEIIADRSGRPAANFVRRNILVAFFSENTLFSFCYFFAKSIFRFQNFYFFLATFFCTVISPCFRFCTRFARKRCKYNAAAAFNYSSLLVVAAVANQHPTMYARPHKSNTNTNISHSTNSRANTNTNISSHTNSRTFPRRRLPTVHA